MAIPDALMRKIMETETAGWTAEQRAALLTRLDREATRLLVARDYPTAGALARRVDPTTRQTEALELIDEQLEWALATPNARLVISMPPQQGKTQRVGVWGVLRALVQNPDRRIVLASYSETLARATAREARNHIYTSGSTATDPLSGARLPDRLGLTLAGDKSAAGNWKLAGHRGGVYATGVGGSLTGQPADCIDGSTVLHCEHGPITAAEAYTNPPKYLMGYNERTGQPTWHKLEAARRIDSRPVIEVTTRGGKSLTCTADHRIYTGGRYTPAGNLRPGETLLHIDTSTGMPDLHGTIHRKAGRGTKNRYPRRPHALLKSLRLGERGAAVPNPFLPLWRPRAEVAPFDMHRQLPAGEVPAGATTRRLPGMRAGIYSQIVPDHVLQPWLRRPGALKAHDGGGELTPPASVVCNTPLSAGAPAHTGAGRIPLRDLRDRDGLNRAPLRRGPGQQPAGEPHNAMPRMSHDTPPVNRDPVSMVTDAGHAPVYDFQVDGDHNFFANGLLVHNCMIIDDPLKGMTEADSRAEREKVITWWESVAQTRLAPGAPVIIIATRWHEDDLTGHLLQQDAARPADQRQWRTVNIPAIATRGVPDALNRAHGEAMPSARGTTLDDWHRVRDSVGERVWSALYLGSPTPAQGGLFSQEWFDRHRAPHLPDTVAARLVAVDPAETGEHDEAGIIGLAVTADGRAWITDDHSGRYTSEQWARHATLLALRTGATELSFEAYTTGTTYEAVLQSAWRRIRHEARLITAAAGDVGTAAINYATEDGAPANPVTALTELQGIRIPDQDTPPFHIRPWRMKGNKTARAAGARQAASTGRLRMVGTHPDLEGQAVAWQAGQSSPDRMDALTQAYERGMAILGSQASIATPTEVATHRASNMGADFWTQKIG